MKTAFLQLCDRITTKVPEIGSVDLDMGQFEISEKRPDLVFPGALVNISYPKAENITDTIQMVDISMVVRVGFDTTADVQLPTAGKLDVVNKLHAALQGWGTDCLSPLSRLSVKSEERTDGLCVFRIEYLSAGEENTEDN